MKDSDSDDLGMAWSRLAEHDIREATKDFVKQIKSRKIIPIVILLVLGIILTAGRNEFYKITPVMIRHSHTTTVLINAISLDFYGMITAIKVITAAVEEAIHIVTAGQFPHDVPHLKHIVEPRMVNASSLRQSLKESSVACNEIKSGFKTVETYFRVNFSPSVCPVLRAASPMGKTGEVLQTLGHFFSFDPTPQGNNCNSGDFDLAMAEVCLTINSGAVILEILLPIVLIATLFRSYFKCVLTALWLSVRTVFAAATTGINAAASLL